MEDHRHPQRWKQFWLGWREWEHNVALAATQFTRQKVSWLGPGVKRVTGVFTGPASYTSGGEALTLAIARAALGLKEVRSLQFTAAVKASDGTSVDLVFDHNVVANTSHGKIRARTSGSTAHTHDVLIIGGQTPATHTHDVKVIGGTAAAGTDALNVKTLILGKEAATDVTVVGADSGTKGGVVASSTPTGLLMVGTDTLGKAEATNRTIAGADSATKGGVVASAASETAGEVAAATNLSTYIARFTAEGN